MLTCYIFLNGKYPRYLFDLLLCVSVNILPSLARCVCLNPEAATEPSIWLLCTATE